MALPASSRLTRTIPSGGSTEDVRGIALDDEVEGGTSTKLATIVQFPGLVWKIAHQVSTVGAEFPDDGTGILPTAPLAGGASTLKLASGVLQSQQATLDPRNLLVMMVTGTAVGQVRLVTSWTPGTQTLGVNRAWGSPNPAAGDQYRLLVDCRYRSNIHISTEQSADAVAATVRIVLYDWSLDGAGAVRKPRRVYDLERASSGIGFQPAAADIETNTRWPGETITISTKGFLGAKVRLITAPTGGANVDVFAATT